MKLVVDGVFFQLARTGIARLWSSLLPRLARCSDLQIVLLDRGGCPSVDGIERVDFPAYSMASNAAADSLLIDRFCTDTGADVFVSTYYTTPVTTPAVLVVYDMIPEILEFGLSERIWQEKQIAISFARYYACISQSTKSDLNRFYPMTRDRSIVTYCGIERDIFYPRDRARIEYFKSSLGISKPYYVLVGSRESYKNGSLVFEAARKFENAEIEILCIGGEPNLRPEVLAGLPDNVAVRRVQLTDDALACAYSGAEALVFPSLYEGFGLPVIEAMACGCPVITTVCGSLAETAGDAALLISGRNEDELRNAMALVLSPTHKKRLVESGLQRASQFDWSDMSRGLYSLLKKAREDSDTIEMKSFFYDWKRLRALQAEVDTYIPEPYRS